MLEPLVPTLAASQSPVVPLVRVYLAICQCFTPSRDAAPPLLDEARREARRRGYHDVLGRAEWVRGYIAEDRNAFDRARDAYDAAIAAYTASGNTDARATVASLAATLHDTLGNYREGWRAREGLLEEVRPGAGRRGRHGVLRAAARAALRGGWGRAALEFATVCTADAHLDTSPIRIAEASIDRARVELHLGLNAQARLSLDDARAAIARIDTLGRPRAPRGPCQHRRGTDRRQSLNGAESSHRGVDRVCRQRIRVDARTPAAGTGAGQSRASSGGGRGTRSAGRHRCVRTRAPGSGRGAGAPVVLQKGLARSSTNCSICRLANAASTRPCRCSNAARRLLRDALQHSTPPAALARALPPRVTIVCYAVLEQRLVIWTVRGGRSGRDSRRRAARGAGHGRGRARRCADRPGDALRVDLADVLIAPIEIRADRGGTCALDATIRCSTTFRSPRSGGRRHRNI